MKLSRISIICLLPFILNAYAGDSSSVDGASAYIVSPGHGVLVNTPFKVVFGLSRMGVAPAGIDKANTGHHHLLIDTIVPDMDRPIPSDANHRHFGGGQTEVVIELAPGKHTLQLLLADYAHTPHSPPVMSEQITIIVK
ncbi:MAG: hypothetical protein ACI909_003688 [Planctomycetota bacterium]|jgi:hypothetical protein